MTSQLSKPETVELLPCPFCGEAQIFLNEPTKTWPRGSINCPGCMAMIPGEVSGAGRERELIACWNARASVAADPVTPQESALRDQLQRTADDLRSHSSNGDVDPGTETFAANIIDDILKDFAGHSQEESDRQHRIDTSVARQLGTAINRNGQLASALRDLLGATRNLAVDMFLRERCEKALLPSQEGTD